MLVISTERLSSVQFHNMNDIDASGSSPTSIISAFDCVRNEIFQESLERYTHLVASLTEWLGSKTEGNVLKQVKAVGLA